MRRPRASSPTSGSSSLPWPAHAPGAGTVASRTVLAPLLALLLAGVFALSLSCTGSTAGASSPSAVTSLQPLHALTPSTRLISPDGRYSAELMSDGRLVLLGPRSRVVWSNEIGGTGDRPRLVLDKSGDLVEYAHRGGPTVWSSGSRSVPGGLELVVQNSGDLVVASSLSPAWSSATGDIPQTLSVVGFGDSEGAETDQFLGGALSDAGGVTTTFVAHDFPGIAVCDWIDNGTMETAVNADVVALFFGGDGFTGCTDPTEHLSAAALENLTVADMGVAVNMLLAGTVQHVLVISPVPGAPTTTIPSTYLATHLQAMVKRLHNRRVTYVDAPSLSVSPAGAAPTTMPCTPLEIAGGVCQGPVVNGVRTNLVFATNGHFCIASLTSDAPATGPSLAPCPGFQPGAWRWANAEAKAIFSLYGLPFEESLQSGYAS